MTVKFTPISAHGGPRISSAENKSKKNLPPVIDDEDQPTASSNIGGGQGEQKTHVFNKGPPPDPNDRNVFLEQIKNGVFNLKKVQKDDRPPVVAKQLSKQEEMSLTSVLAKAIADRRKQLTKNDAEDEEESDWSDD